MIQAYFCVFHFEQRCLQYGYLHIQYFVVTNCSFNAIFFSIHFKLVLDPFYTSYLYPAQDYLLLRTVWSRVILEKLTGFQLVKKFPAFYGTWRFITAVTCAGHLSPSGASSIQSILPHPTSWKTILILSSHLCLGLPSGLFPSGFLTKTLYMLLLSPICATCSVHLILLVFITRTILVEEYRSLSSLLYSFLHSPVTSFLLGSKFSSAPYSQTSSAYVPPSMWESKFHTHTKQHESYSSLYVNL